jgi:hypothetical protein
MIFKTSIPEGISPQVIQGYPKAEKWKKTNKHKGRQNLIATDTSEKMLETTKCPLKKCKN